MSEIEAARHVLETEAVAIRLAGERLDSAFVKAVDLLYADKGKIIITGLGKSGHVGRKIAATFCSTGAPAVFMHAAEASHGDLGVHQSRDPVIFLSNSGSTDELQGLVPAFRERGSSLIGILGNPHGPLACKVDVVLDASVVREADPLDMVPTASFSVAAAMGDALAAALMSRREFTEEDYARSHPGGQLGRNLNLNVGSVMHPLERVACCREDATLRDLVIGMTEHPLGAACIIRDDQLIGIVTDGDLRRALREHEDVRDLKAISLMSPNPTTTTSDSAVGTALRLMEERASQIAVLPVVDPDGTTFLGLLRLHDIYSPAES